MSVRGTLLAACILAILPAAAASGPPQPRNRYDEVVRRVRLLSDSPNVRLLPFGRSAAGRTIPALAISDFSEGREDKARVLVCAGQHGDEYDSVRSVLSLCSELAAGGRPALLSKCVFVVVPAVNPDGLSGSRRWNSQGLDTNRDWMALGTPEARYVDRIVRTWKPQALIDAHEWTEETATPGNEIEVPKCVARTQSRAMSDLATRVERSSGLVRFPCSPRSDKRLFHRRYALRGYASFLLETAQGKDYAYRRHAYVSAIVTVAGALAEDEQSRLVLSPASAGFDADLVSAYVENAPISASQAQARSGLLLTSALLGGCCLLAWLSRPQGRADNTTWSRRFRKCSVDVDIAPDARRFRRALPPITAKSWVHRRLRARYADCGGGNKLQ